MKRPASCIVGFLVAAVGSAAPLRVDAADDQFATVQHTDYLYKVDVGQRVVRVTAHLRIVNDGNHGDRACLEQFQLRFPVGATAVRVMDRTVLLDHDVVAAEGGATETSLRVTLQECLQYGRQDGLELTYEMPAGAPRSQAPARISDESIGFVVWGAGRAGGSSITLEMPDQFTAASLTEGWTMTTQGTTAIYETGPIRDPNTFTAVISAHIDGESRVDVSVDDHEFFVVPQPGDEEWSDWVSDQLPTALHDLEAATGVPWPSTAAMTLRETYSPTSADAVSWPTTTGTAQVGEQLDDVSLRRGLATSWFGSEHFADGWLADALADSYAGVASEPDGATAAIDALREDLGPDVMSSVLADVIAGVSAYGIATDEPMTWRMFLDLLEERGASTSAQDALAPFVDAAEGAPFDERPAARAAYVALRDRGGELTPPLAVRSAMDAWEFEVAGDLIAAADDVLDAIEQLREALADTGVAVPGTISTAYADAATAEDLLDLAADVRVHAGVADELARSVLAERETGGLIDTIGLISSDLDDRLAEAKTAFESGEPEAARVSAFRAITEANSATFEGVKRIVLAWGLVLAALVATLSVRDIRRFLHARRAPVTA